MFHLLLDTESENEMRADGRIEVWSIDTVQKRDAVNRVRDLRSRDKEEFEGLTS